jgi:hypothetical protein
MQHLVAWLLLYSTLRDIVHRSVRLCACDLSMLFWRLLLAGGHFMNAENAVDWSASSAFMRYHAEVAVNPWKPGHWWVNV